MKKLFIFTATLAALFVQNALAWNHPGHMVVAQIAYDNLSDKARARCGELVAVKVEPQKVVVHFPNGKSQTIDERHRTGTFVTAACWADDVKSNADREWHYLNLPISPDGTVPQLTHTSGNVVAALNHAVEVLRGNAIKTEKARQLRYLLHLAGDIHQPLHCVTRCTETRPEGDRGGNDFPIIVIGAENLHAFWDSGVKLFPSNLERPLIQTSIDKLKEIATACTNANPKSTFTAELAVKDFHAWAEEGCALAESIVYSGLEPGERPSADYVTHGQALVRKRVALAGYRLAELLNSIFK